MVACASVIVIVQYGGVFAASKEFHNLAIKQFAVPGEPGWPLGTLFPLPANRTESGAFRVCCLFVIGLD